jgi:hypothetical protein
MLMYRNHIVHYKSTRYDYWKKENKFIEKQKGQSRMDNPETANIEHKTLNKDKQNTTQITNKMSNMDPIKTMNPCKAKQPIFLICHVL